MCLTLQSENLFLFPCLQLKRLLPFLHSLTFTIQYGILIEAIIFLYYTYIWVHPLIHLAIQKRIKSIRNKNLLVWVIQYPKLGLELALIEQVRQHWQADRHLSSLRYTEAVLQLELVGVTSNRYHVTTTKGNNLTVVWSKNLQIIYNAYDISF